MEEKRGKSICLNTSMQQKWKWIDYHTYAIIIRSLYIFFYPFFTVVYILDRLVLQIIYVINKETLQFLGVD